MNDKVIGIIGGMGPEATLNFYGKLIKMTNAKNDQEHFHVIIDSNSKTPDRTKAILSGGEDPLPYMIESVKNLEKMNVHVACITCFTAHYYIEELQKEASYPIINALEELDIFIKSEYPSVTRVGVLCTSGTKRSGLYNKYLKDFDLIYPDEFSQENEVMESVYGKNGIKSGNKKGMPLELLTLAGNKLIEKGAQILIAGCTEVGLLLPDFNFAVSIIDPMDVVVLKLISD